MFRVNVTNEDHFTRVMCRLNIGRVTAREFIKDVGDKLARSEA